MAQPFQFNLPTAASVLPKGQGKLSLEGIFNLLTQNRQSFSQTAFPSILPLLQPSQGVSPEVQASIDQLTKSSQEGTSANLANLTTEFQKRGLTGSSIEGFGLAQGAAEGQKSLQNSILPLLLQSSQQRVGEKSALASFLERAYGQDVGQQEGILQLLAGLLGGEIGRQNQRELLGMQLDAQPGLLEQLLPSLIGAGATLGGAAILK